MKILSFYAGPPRGGCYERLVRLQAALARRGAVIHAVVQSKELATTPGVVVHPLGRRDGTVSFARLLSATRVAARVAQAEGAEGVLVFGSAYAAVLAPFLGNRRLVTFLRGSWIEQERARGSGLIRLALVGATERLALRASTRVLAVSRGAAPPSFDPLVIPNDAPEPRQMNRTEARTLLGLPLKGFIAGSLGLPAPIKSLETLIEAAGKSQTIHIALSGFGSGSAYEASLRGRAAGLMAEGRAHLLTWVDRNAFLSALDVLVIPSRHEGSPNGLLEGLAAGLPCFGSRVPGIEETLADEAMLFPFADASALAERLSTVEASPAALAEVAHRAAARAAAYRFDWDEVASSAVLAAMSGVRASE